MPRSKKPAARGKGRGGQQPLGHYDFPFNTTSGTSRQMTTQESHLGGFSLQSEAFNTQRHQLSFTSDQRLRHAKVNFISAGNAPPVDLLDPEAALAKMSLEEPSRSVKQSSEKLNDATKPYEVAEDSNITPNFTIDTVGDRSIVTGLCLPEVRSPSPTPSDMSDEVILFMGRADRSMNTMPSHLEGEVHPLGKVNKVIEDTVPEEKSPLVNASNTIRDDVPKSGDLDDSKSSFIPLENMTNLSDVSVGPLLHTAKFESHISSRKKKKNRNKQSRRRHKRDDADDALVADYLSNLTAHGLDVPKFFGSRPLGGVESDTWQETESSDENSPPYPGDGWDLSDLHDFDDMSTSQDSPEPIMAVLGKRLRNSGLQYLVVGKDQDVGEARWIPEQNLKESVSRSLINKFEAEHEHDPIAVSDDDGGTSDEDIEEVDIDQDEDDENEDELIQRKIEGMTDEKIARLLAKQEELGMGSNELVLFDDSPDDEDLGDSFISHKAPKNKKRGKTSSRRAKGEFPAASVLADAFDDFDVMDWERPSLQTKQKGRRGKVAFDLSDSELEMSLQNAWENDRIRKKERKEEREDLRARGLLGKRNNKPNLKAKYQEGMGIDAIKQEIKDFLISGNSTLALPPMDKADRKVVHEIANAFNLKSKSTGNGQKRFPILYRTSKTSEYSESSFLAMEAKLARRFLPRMDLKGKRGRIASVQAGRGGFSMSAVSYQDGDIVGGSAPELGVENKGRVMLERMGWSTGTALGAINNKGILQPVAHVVKTTKAGLG